MGQCILKKKCIGYHCPSFTIAVSTVLSGIENVNICRGYDFQDSIPCETENDDILMWKEGTRIVGIGTYPRKQAGCSRG